MLRWVPFVENDFYVRLVDAVAARYGKRPSEIVGIDDLVIALDFDAAILIRAVELEKIEPEPDEKEVKEKQAMGFDSLRALQQQVIESYGGR